jgi:DNA-binding response OmpR family regulator
MSQTILVVDDDPDLLETHRLVLERAGYRVLTASDGEEGLRAGKLEKPDVVLLDVLMPKKSGFAVLENLKETFQESISIIMLTANGADAHRSYAACLGADAYLEKPISIDDLLGTIRKVCSNSGPNFGEG